MYYDVAKSIVNKPCENHAFFHFRKIKKLRINISKTKELFYVIKSIQDQSFS